MFLERIYDNKLAQAAYIIGCQKTGAAIVIDPERDIDRYLQIAEDNGLRITAVTETHIHADFLSGAREIAEKTGATLYLSGEGGEEWKYNWLDKKSGGGYYEHQIIFDGDSISVGNVEIKAVHTPGHTPEHLSFMVTDHGAGVDDPIGLVTGDFVFVGDVGRPDLLESAAGQEGAAEPAAHELWDSLRWFDRLDDYLQVWPGHGAGSACGKSLGAIPTTTVGYEKRFNKALVSSRNDSRSFTKSILDGQPDAPFYFARMKTENREGPALLGDLPTPQSAAAVTVVGKLKSGEAVLLDTRPWAEYRKGHIQGAFHIPFDKSFPTLAGSYVRPEQNIYLIIDQENVEEATRNLVRVGLDKVAGYLTPQEAATYILANGDMKSEILATTTEGLSATLREKNVTVLDVRGEADYRVGHVRGALQLAHTRLLAGLKNLPEETLYVHCQTGVRSAAAAGFLQAKGKSVIYVSGRFNDFAGAGVPIAASPTQEAEATA